MNGRLFTESEVSGYFVSMNEEDALDTSMFESEPSYGYGIYDVETVEILKTDMIDTAG